MLGKIMVVNSIPYPFENYLKRNQSARTSYDLRFVQHFLKITEFSVRIWKTTVAVEVDSDLIINRTHISFLMIYYVQGRVQDLVQGGGGATFCDIYYPPRECYLQRQKFPIFWCSESEFEHIWGFLAPWSRRGGGGMALLAPLDPPLIVTNSFL